MARRTSPPMAAASTPTDRSAGSRSSTASSPAIRPGSAPTSSARSPKATATTSSAPTVDGNIGGDQQNIAASTIFAAIDPVTHGGQVNADGIVPAARQRRQPGAECGRPVRRHAHRPAGPRPAAARPTSAPPSPAMPSPPIPRPAMTCSPQRARARSISGLNGADRVLRRRRQRHAQRQCRQRCARGRHRQRQAQRRHGDRCRLLRRCDRDHRRSTPAAPTPSTAAAETDTLTGIKGVVGTRAADTFKGDAGDNWFMGGDGKDLYTTAAATTPSTSTRSPTAGSASRPAT